VLTTAAVATVLAAELHVHNCARRGVKKRLVRFDLNSSTPDVWGAGPAMRRPRFVPWRTFWSTLEQCGQPDWPQLARVPSLSLQQLKQLHGGVFSRQDIVAALRHAAAELRFSDGADELLTLAGNADGQYTEIQLSDRHLGQSSDPEDDDADDDRRQVVFIDARALFGTSR